MTYPVFATGDVLNASDMNAVGLWLVKSQTIGTGVSSVTVTGAFSADYDNYKIVIAGGTSSAQTNITFQLGSSASNYYGTYLYANYTVNTPLAASINNLSTVLYAGGANINSLNMNMELQAPYLAKHTTMQGLSVLWQNNYGHTICDHEVNTSHTAFTIAPGTGTLTGGTIYVYGYKK